MLRGAVFPVCNLLIFTAEEGEAPLFTRPIVKLSLLQCLPCFFMMTFAIIISALYTFLVWSMLRAGKCPQEAFYD